MALDLRAAKDKKRKREQMTWSFSSLCCRHRGASSFGDHGLLTFLRAKAEEESRRIS